MALVSVTDITVLSNPARFEDPYRFRITFECIAGLAEGSYLIPLSNHADDLYVIDIEWKLVYVGSAHDTHYDQELDACMVGPVPEGVNSFEFEVSLNVFPT